VVVIFAVYFELQVGGLRWSENESRELEFRKKQRGYA
jgi:hypothetical protein